MYYFYFRMSFLPTNKCQDTACMQLQYSEKNKLHYFTIFIYKSYSSLLMKIFYQIFKYQKFSNIHTWKTWRYYTGTDKCNDIIHSHTFEILVETRTLV